MTWTRRIRGGTALKMSHLNACDACMCALTSKCQAKYLVQGRVMWGVAQQAHERQTTFCFVDVCGNVVHVGLHLDHVEQQLLEGERTASAIPWQRTTVTLKAVTANYKGIVDACTYIRISMHARDTHPARRRTGPSAATSRRNSNHACIATHFTKPLRSCARKIRQLGQAQHASRPQIFLGHACFL